MACRVESGVFLNQAGFDNTNLKEKLQS